MNIYFKSRSEQTTTILHLATVNTDNFRRLFKKHVSSSNGKRKIETWEGLHKEFMAIPSLLSAVNTQILTVCQGSKISCIATVNYTNTFHEIHVLWPSSDAEYYLVISLHLSRCSSQRQKKLAAFRGKEYCITGNPSCHYMWQEARQNVENCY